MPGNPCAENNLGVLAWRRGERDEAARRFKIALHAVPDNAVFAGNLDGTAADTDGFAPKICLDINPDISN